MNNIPDFHNKDLDPDYVEKEQEKTMKRYFGDDGYEVLTKLVKGEHNVISIMSKV